MSANPKQMHVRRSELLTSVAASATELARDFGLPDNVAEQVGAAVADTIAEQWGGQVLSIPKDFHFKLSQRDREILEHRRQGATAQEIARQYNMHVRSVRRLLRRAELRGRDDRQQQLFGE